MKSISKFWLNWLIIFTIVLCNISLNNIAYAEDLSTELTNKKVSIVQNGSEIGEGGTIDGNKPVTFTVSFKVPTKNDYPTPAKYVKYGDTARITLGKGIKILKNKTDVLFKDKKIGTASIKTISDSDKTVVLDILFDGDKNIFEGTEYNNLNANVVADFDLDISDIPETGGQKPLVILGKTYTINVNPAAPVISVEKTGKVIPKDNSIEWEITVKGTKNGKQADLKGFSISDDLTTAGDYKVGSFKINNIEKTPVHDSSKKTLEYTFKEGDISPQKIILRTKLTGKEMYATHGSKITKTNKVQVLDSKKTAVANAEASTIWTPVNRWIKKSYKTDPERWALPKGRDYYKVSWIIDLQNNDTVLENVVITDKLDDKIYYEFDEDGKRAEIREYNPVTKQFEKTKTIDPNSQGEYSIGKVDKPMQLVIFTKIKVSDFYYPNGTNYFHNKASATWNNLDTPYFYDEYLGLGKRSIRKDVTDTNPKTKNYSNSIVEWKIILTDGHLTSLDNVRVYDLVIFDTSVTHENKASLTFGSTPPADLNITSPQEVFPKYLKYHKVIPESLEALNAQGITTNSHKVYLNGNHVGDLLEFKGFQKIGKDIEFAIKTRATDPNTLISNSTLHTVVNAVYLYSGKNVTDYNEREVNVRSRMLNKSALDAIDADNFKNSYDISHINKDLAKDNTNFAFNQKTKSIIYRLSINANNLTNTQEYLKPVIVQDILPDGWEFVNIKNSDKYLIYEGEQAITSPLLDETNKALFDKVIAKGSPLASLAGLNAQVDGKNAKFTFTNLSSPYVILLEARPTQDKLKEYVKSEKEIDITNTANLSLDGVALAQPVKRSQIVKFNTKVLGKEQEKVEDGILKWHIDYNPNEVISDTNLFLEDILSTGMEIRKNSEGKPDFSNDNFEIYETSTDAYGKVILGKKLDNLQDLITYDATNRKLSLKIPQSNKSYRFYYITDLTGKAGIAVNNTVSLKSGEFNFNIKPDDYIISAFDANATLEKNAWLEVLKVDGKDQKLKGAEFTLTLENGEERKVLTDDNGIAKFNAIPINSNGKNHTLKETKAPNGYELNSKEYKVVVDETKIPMVSINEQTGENSNKIKIINKKFGTLQITNTVKGSHGDTKKPFEFTIDLGTDKTKVYNYEGTGIANGTIKSGDKINLTHNQSILIKEIPMNTNYTVTETDYTSDGYTTTVDPDTNPKRVASGTIKDGNENPKELFINTKDKFGTLKVTNTVIGTDSDPAKPFEFTIDLGTDKTKVYNYEGTGIANGTIKSGDKINLKHNQSILIKEIPMNTDYTVTETDYTSDGYTTTVDPDTNPKRIASGTIKDGNENPKELFINKKDLPPTPPPKTGSLKVTNTVIGTDSDPAKPFEFTIDLGTDKTKVYNYEGTGIANGTIKSGDKISLTHNQSILIKEIPMNTDYTVTETDYTSDGYTTTVDPDTNPKRVASGTIKDGNENPKELFINKKDLPPAPKTGSLKITKKVEGLNAQLDKQFNFQITFNSLEEYDYIGENGAPSGKIKSGDNFTLSNNQSIIIQNIKEDTQYQITEDYYADYDKKVTVGSDNGQIQADKTTEVQYTNTFKTPPPAITTSAILQIRKILIGNAYNTQDTFRFKISFPDNPTNIYDYEKEGHTGTIGNLSEFELKGGETITIKDIPDGERYTLTEIDYKDYTPLQTEITGTITTNPLLKNLAEFTNEKTQGKLKITNTVGGNAGDTNKDFEYTITIGNDPNKEYIYEGIGIPNGTIKSGQTIIIKHGQGIIIKEIPKNTNYKVEQKDYTSDGYTTTFNQNTGTITDKQEQADYLNIKNVTSSTINKSNLKISKKVKGESSNKEDVFTFKINFDKDVSKIYNFEKEGQMGTIKDNDTFQLSDGQSIIIKDIEEGIQYTVTEIDTKGYTPEKQTIKGNIQLDLNNNIVEFVNKKEEAGGIGGPGDNSGGNSGGGDSGGGNSDDSKDDNKTKDKPKEQPKDKKEDTQKDKKEDKTKTPSKSENKPKPNKKEDKTPTNKQPKKQIIINKEKIQDGKKPVMTIIDKKGNPIGKAIVDPEKDTYVFIDDDRVPEGKAKLHDDNKLEILEDEIPKSGLAKKSYPRRILPKTGESSTAYTSIGVIILGLGITLLLKTKSNKNKR